MNQESNKLHPMLGKHCVIRTYSAGVHVGIVEQTEGMEVLLKDSQRIWCWEGAFTLSAVAIDGVKDGSRISRKVPEIYLTEAIEFIPTTQEARDSYEKYTEE